MFGNFKVSGLLPYVCASLLSETVLLETVKQSYKLCVAQNVLLETVKQSYKRCAEEAPLIYAVLSREL